MDRNPAEAIEAALPTGLDAAWTLDRDAPCLRCGYNLRGLRIPKCPECGMAFRWLDVLKVACPRCEEPLGEKDGAECPRCKLPLAWERLLREAACTDPNFYEYSERPKRAMVRTWFAVLRPRRFWRRVPLELPPVTKRLMAFRRAAVCVGFLAMLATYVFVALVPLLNVFSSRYRTYYLAKERFWDYCLPELRGRARYYLQDGIELSVALAILFAGIPSVTGLLLPRFTPTLTHFKIRPSQMRRCATYGTTLFVYAGLLMLTATIADGAANASRSGGWWSASMTGGLTASRELGDLVDFLMSIVVLRRDWLRGLSILLSCLIPASLGWFVWYTYASLRCYLRLDRRNAAALSVSSVTIATVAAVLAIALLRVVELAPWFG